MTLPVSLPKTYDIAYRLYAAGKYRDAEGVFRELIAVEERNYHFWMGLGACLQVQKKLGTAVEAYMLAALFEAEEVDPLPHLHAAECLYLLGETKTALKALESAKSIANKDDKYYGLIEQLDFLKERWTHGGN
jgi:type III secretion system low calcium response chaperone LcrH/SycD